MAFTGQRSLVTVLCAAFIASSCMSAFAQGAGDAKQAEQQKPPEPKSEAAHLADVARTLSGQAALPECTHLGEFAIIRMAKDDMDTAFRYMDLYDRFGCPGKHIQESFRCLLLAGIPSSKDSTASLENLVRNCWAPKATAAAPAAPAAPATPAPASPPSTAGAGAR